MKAAVAAAGVAAVVSSGEKSESDDFSCQEKLFHYMQNGLTWPLREPEVGKCAWQINLSTVAVAALMVVVRGVKVKRSCIHEKRDG